MKTEIVTKPSDWNPEELLELIEKSPESFTYGRRNNDIFNWAIAFMLKLKDEGKDFSHYLYLNEITDRMDALYFSGTHSILTPTQRDALKDYDRETDINMKIRRIWELYRIGFSSHVADRLWLTMDYLR